MLPPGIVANTVGSETNSNPFPINGSNPKATTAGMTTKPEIRQMVSWTTFTVMKSVAISISSSTYLPYASRHAGPSPTAKRGHSSGCRPHLWVCQLCPVRSDVEFNTFCNSRNQTDTNRNRNQNEEQQWKENLTDFLNTLLNAS